MSTYALKNFKITSLVHAVMIEDLDAVEAALNNGEDIESLDQGYTALQAACGNLDIAKLLLDRGADVNTKCRRGATALHFAAHHGQINVVNLLISRGANINEKGHDGNTPLHIAVMRNSLGVVKVLLENGANIEAKNKYGTMPISMASVRSDDDIMVIRELLINGANPFIKFQDINHLNRYFHGDLSWAPVELQKKWERMSKGKSTFGI